MFRYTCFCVHDNVYNYSPVSTLVQYVYGNVHRPQIDRETYTYGPQTLTATLIHTHIAVPCRCTRMSYTGIHICTVYKVKYKMHVFVPT